MLDVEFLMVGEPHGILSPAAINVHGGLSPPFSTGFLFVFCIPEVSPLRGYTSGYESCALSGLIIPLAYASHMFGLRMAEPRAELKSPR